MVKLLPGTAPPAPFSASLAVATRAGGAAVDACAYLFRACRDLERRYADDGIACLFDVAPVKLPVTLCRAIAAMMGAVLDDVAATHRHAGTVALTVQRRGAGHAVVIEDRGLRDYDAGASADLAPVRALAAQCGGVCRIRAEGDRRIVVALFGPDATVH